MLPPLPKSNYKGFWGDAYQNSVDISKEANRLCNKHHEFILDNSERTMICSKCGLGVKFRAGDFEEIDGEIFDKKTHTKLFINGTLPWLKEKNPT